MVAYRGSIKRSGLTLDQERVEMLRLHAEGVDIYQIADQFKYSPATIYSRVRSALNEKLSLRAEEYRKIQDIQIDALTEKAIEHITSDNPDVSLKGLVVMVKLLERRAKLHGLDAPQTVQVNAEVHSVSEEAKQRIEEARARLEAITASSGPPALRAVEQT